MRRRQIRAAAERLEAMRGQMGEHVEKGVFAVVAAVIVGEGDDIEAGRGHTREAARVGLEGELLQLGPAERGDDAFEVAEGEVKAAQVVAGGAEREGIVLGGGEHVVVDGACEHHVAGDGDGDGAHVGRGGGLRRGGGGSGRAWDDVAGRCGGVAAASEPLHEG